MNNNFLVADWIAMKSLSLLKNKLAVANCFWTGANAEFTKPFAVGPSVQIKKPQRFIPTVGLGYQPQPINRISTTVNMTDPFGVHFDWDSYERAVNMERGEDAIEREYLDPAMAALAQQIDSYAAQFAYLNTNNIVGQLGTNPSTFDATSAAARERMAQLSGAQDNDDRACIVSPTIMRALKSSAVGFFNPVRDIEKQWRTGIVGSGDSFEWYESVSLYSHTAGTWAGAVSVATTAVDGASSLALTCTSGDTFLAGDVIAVTGTNMVNTSTRRKPGVTTLKQFVITQSVTATSTAQTVQISPTIYGPGSQYQNVDVLPTSTSTVTLFPGTTSPNGLSGTQNLAFTNKAFALVAIPLELPNSCEAKSQKRDPETGISIRFTRTWDAINSRMINRFDTLIGFGNLYGDECSVRILGA